jgi:GMP synthase-like glutamine amidotransferase
MRIAILQTGTPPGDMAETFGSYPDMFETLLAGDGRSFEQFDVTRGQYPKPGAFDALLITGSAAGAYEPLPWIAPLKDFLVEAKGKAPMVGICFGHQVMAEAFGGRVEKSDKGWGIGLHHYDVTAREPWMDADAAGFAIPASHQDQVTVQPPHAHVIAASAFTPFAGLAYDDQPAISFQGHPEFDPAYAEALLIARRGTRFTEAVADAAIGSLEEPNNRHQVGRWICAFLDESLL